MSNSNVERLKAAGVLKDEHVGQFGDAEHAHVEKLSQEDIDHLIRMKEKMTSAGTGAAPIACFF